MNLSQSIPGQIPLLQLSAVTKSFGSVSALKGVSFDLQPGEIHALLGGNGAGKSTLIKIVAGAHSPDSGSIKIHGHRVTQLTPSAARNLGIACIYQQPSLFPDLTVAENIALRLEKIRLFARVHWTNRRLKAVQLLKLIGADISPDTEVRDLSMPQQQLVEIACALGSKARIILMDEPTASLTHKEQERLFALVRTLRNDGVGIIYISHRLEEIFAIADRVTVLRDGESTGTTPVTETNPSALIKRMVGREVSTLFPPAESQPGPMVLSLRGLGCTAGGVKNITLDLRAGEIVGLTGLVGAGRTELARVLFGITPADTGEISLNGQWVVITSPQDAIALGIAYLPEDRRRQGVILEMPLSHNITLASHQRLFPRNWLRHTTEQTLAEKFIEDLAVKTSGAVALGNSLSGGNQQKVSLARWLATKPKLLILDEPTQGIDIGAKNEIHKIIRRLAKEGLAVLMISSDLPEVLGMSDRIAVLRGGTVAAILPRQCTAHQVMSASLGLKEKGVGT